MRTKQKYVKFIIVFCISLYQLSGIAISQILPNIYSAADFSLLSGGNIGAYDSVYCIGKIGSLGTVSNKLVANDSIIPNNNGSVSSAIINLNNAIEFCGNQGGTIISDSLGGQTLLPGIYKTNASANLSGNLTLSGDSTAKYIFNVSDSLIVLSGSSVSLGKVRPYNVFWIVEGNCNFSSLINFSGVVIATGDVRFEENNYGHLTCLAIGSINFNQAGLSTFNENLLYSINQSKYYAMAADCIYTFDCNYIRNYSFEDYKFCPTGRGQIDLACSWVSATGGTPDFFSTCSTSPLVQVPTNNLANEAPHNIGNGYAAIYAMAYYANGREYIQQELLQPLTAGDYYFEMWVSLADNCLLAVDGMGAYFSNGPITAVNYSPLNLYTPQVSNPNGVILDETDGWTKISGCFHAQGGEDFVTIGNFKLDANTAFVPTGNNDPFGGALYLIDDVSLIKLPDAGFDQIGTFCSGIPLGSSQTTCLNNFHNINYRWSPEANLNDASLPNPILNYTNTTSSPIVLNYSLLVNFGNCSYTDIVEITILPKPTIFITSNPVNATLSPCTTSVELSASSGFSAYQWVHGPTTSSVTVNQPGIYTVSATDADGCSASSSITVSYDLNPQLVVNPAEPILTACLRSAILTASGPFIYYQWSNGTIGQSTTVSQSGVYTVIGITANGCHVIKQVTVLDSKILPTPEITGPRILCNDYGTSLLNNSYTISNWDSRFGKFYHWSVIAANGTVITPIFGATTQTASITWPNFDGGIITISVGTGPECMLVGSFNVNNCCFGPGSNGLANCDCIATIAAGPSDRCFNASTSNSLQFGGGIISFPNNFVISGDLIVDNVQEISNSPHLYFSKNAQITIKSGASLTLNSCILQSSCDYMWDGIVVEDGGSLQIINCEIYDAINAIKATNFHSVNSIIDIDECKFERNHINIDLSNSNFATAFFNMWGGRFNSLYDLKEPYKNQRTYCHINLNNVNSIDLSGMTPYLNTFENADYGILARNSSMHLIQAAFMNFLPGALNFQDVTAIKTFVDYSFDQGDPYIELTKDITFDNCYRGVRIINQSSIITNNTFTSTNKGISIENGYRRLDYIFNNTLTNTVFAISNLNQWFSNVRIEGNTIVSPNCNIGGLYNCNDLGFEIRVVALLNNVTSNNTVINNEVTTHGSGIWCLNSLNTLVKDNTVRLYGDIPTRNKVAYGIRLENCKSPEISCNWSGGVGSNRTNPGVLGSKRSISLSFTKNALVSCNTTDFSLTGMEFWADCLPSTLTGNLMRNHRVGLQLGAVVGSLITPGVLGHQSVNNFKAPGNIFDGDGSGNFGLASTYSIGSNAGAYDFQITNEVGNYWPQVNLASLTPGTTPFAPTSINSEPYECPDDCQRLAPRIPDEEIDLTLANEIATDSIVISNDPLIQWLIQRGLYEQLLNEPSLLNNNDILQAFYSDMDATNLARLAEIKYIMGFYGDLSEEELADLPIDSIASIMLHAKELNGNFNAQSIYEENERIVNEIFLNSFGSERNQIDAEAAEQLYSIAIQCPFAGGPAVYRARGLYLVVNDSIYFDDEEACNSINYRISADMGIPDYFVFAYPNPAQDILTFDYELIDFNDASVSIFDLTGRLILEKALNIDETQSKINLANLSSGIYFYRVIGDGQDLKQEKIIIIK